MLTLKSVTGKSTSHGFETPVDDEEIKLLRRVADEGRSLVIEKRGSPRAVLLSIKDYVRLALPEPEVLRAIGMESKRRGTSKLTGKQIAQIITAARRSKRR